MNPARELKKIAHQLKSALLYGRTVNPRDDSKIGELIEAIDVHFVDWDPDDKRFKEYVQKVYGRSLSNKELIAELKSNKKQDPYLIADLVERISGPPVSEGKKPLVTSKPAQRYLKIYDFEFGESTIAESSVGIGQTYDYWVGPENTDYYVYVYEDGTWRLENDETAMLIAEGKNSEALKWTLKDLFPET